MIKIKFFNAIFCITTPTRSRTLKNPIKNSHACESYVFGKLTRAKYNIPSLPYSDKWIKTDELVAKRIWESLWEEGWR